MPRLRIDQHEIDVPPGTTVLAAARQLGIDIPTLCYLEGYPASTSCLVCVVKLAATGRFVPACATLAEDGMEVHSETAEVHQMRRTALELLLSDHLGDCLAPCWFGCPAHMDIPLMLRQIAAGDFRGAIATVKADIAFPAVLGRICPAPCENVCRRSDVDQPVAICLLKRFVADVDLASGTAYTPTQAPDSGKRVAIVGGGPTGLAAAYYLAQQGHRCTIFEQAERLGGRLWQETATGRLPPEVLQAEIATLLLPGVDVRLGVRVGPNDKAADAPVESGSPANQSPAKPAEGDAARLATSTASLPSVNLAALRRNFDAVLIACGTEAREQAVGWGVELGNNGIAVSRSTLATNLSGVFAAGCAVRGKAIAVRSVADGRQAAVAIGQYLSGRREEAPQSAHFSDVDLHCSRAASDESTTGSAARLPSSFTTRIGKMDQQELALLMTDASPVPRAEPEQGTSAGYSPVEASRQARRCLHCDCRALNSCKLRRYAIIYNAQPRRFAGQRRRFERYTDHPEVVFEPGKCIDCGLCIEVARAAGERLGLTFAGRGFDIRVAAPLNKSLAEALQKAAAKCVSACPTGALAWKAPHRHGVNDTPPQ